MLSGVLGSHFIDVKETLNFKAIIVIIYVIIIISRVVFVKSDETGVDGYVLSVLKSCQHDKLKPKHDTYTVDI